MIVSPELHLHQCWVAQTGTRYDHNWGGPTHCKAHPPHYVHAGNGGGALSLQCRPPIKDGAAMVQIKTPATHLPDWISRCLGALGDTL
jgi:hypothetical protein